MGSIMYFYTRIIVFIPKTPHHGVSWISKFSLHPKRIPNFRPGAVLETGRHCQSSSEGVFYLNTRFPAMTDPLLMVSAPCTVVKPVWVSKAAS